MEYLAPYSNRTSGTDFVLYFHYQVSEADMARSFYEWGHQFIVWTCDREDKITICWVQNPQREKRKTMENWFRRFDVSWVGTTGGVEEFSRWFRMDQPDKYKWRGHYHVRLITGEVSGHRVVEEIIEATESMRISMEEDDDHDGLSDEQPGQLIKAEALFF